ncbi:hypothetical protein PENTCL1PPCAC_29207, partial [Pristionchus entomophagus]
FADLPNIFSFVHNPHSLIRLKAAFAILQFILEGYAFWIARRCHSYIKFTADNLEKDKVDPEKAVAIPTNGCSLPSSEFVEMRRVPSLILKGETRLPQPSPLSLPTIHGNGSTTAHRLQHMQPQTDC